MNIKGFSMISIIKSLNLGILIIFTLLLVACGKGKVYDNGIYGFILNNEESVQMEGKMQNPPADKARIYVITDYMPSNMFNLANSDLKEYKYPFGDNIIRLKTETQMETKSESSHTFGFIKSGIFSVDIIPNGEAIYLYKNRSTASALFSSRSDGWSTRLIVKAGYIHCLSLYQRALNWGTWEGKMIANHKKGMGYPVIWAEKKDCIDLVNRIYNDKIEYLTTDKDEKTKLKAQRLERENKLRKERGYEEINLQTDKTREIKHLLK